MTRRRVTLQLIKNRSARKVTYQKRKKGVLKKTDELNALCDVDMCVVIMSECDATPTVWPSLSGLQHVVTRFNNLPESEKTKHQSNLEEFNNKRLQKIEKQLQKQLCENKELETNLKINECLNGESSLPQDLDAMDLEVKRKLKELDMKIKNLKIENRETTRTDDMQAGGSTNNVMDLPIQTQQPFSGWNDNPLSPFSYDVFQPFPSNMGDNHGA